MKICIILCVDVALGEGKGLSALLQGLSNDFLISCLPRISKMAVPLEGVFCGGTSTGVGILRQDELPLDLLPPLRCPDLFIKV
jgi:hypothetical protein